LLKYIPTDISGGILKNSVLELQEKYPNFSIQGLVGIYQQTSAYLESTATPVSFPAECYPKGETVSSTEALLTRTICFLRSYAGNFPPQKFDNFLTQIARILQPGNYFLLRIYLHKSQEILEVAYNYI